MEVVQFLPQLGKALWSLKGMYDQHVRNRNEIKELQVFIQDYAQQILVLQKRFEEGGGNHMGIAALKTLERDVMEATTKLKRWSRNKKFFRVLNSAERMQKLEKLRSKFMASMQNNLGIANLSMHLDMQATQATILESNAELRFLLTTAFGNTHGTLPTNMRDEMQRRTLVSRGASNLELARWRVPELWEVTRMRNAEPNFSSDSDSDSDPRYVRVGQVPRLLDDERDFSSDSDSNSDLDSDPRYVRVGQVPRLLDDERDFSSDSDSNSDLDSDPRYVRVGQVPRLRNDERDFSSDSDSDSYSRYVPVGEVPGLRVDELDFYSDSDSD